MKFINFFYFLGSLPSLGAGLAFGAVLGGGAYLNSQHPPKPMLQLCTSLLLSGVMGLRWYKSGKMMPAGLICTISICAALRNIIAYNKYYPVIGQP